jgi:hypothetical protein
MAIALKVESLRSMRAAKRKSALKASNISTYTL